VTTDPQQGGPRGSDADDRSMEAAEADLSEQETSVAAEDADTDAGWMDDGGGGPPAEASEADAVEQMREVGPDDEDDYR
jgi:hypothetical protein